MCRSEETCLFGFQDCWNKHFLVVYKNVCVCIQSTVHPTSCLDSRLLETDSKSLRSMNGSRRNSGSSLVSSSSASSNLSHLEEDSWILWGRIVNEWEEVRKKKEKQLKVRPVHTTTCDMSVRSLMKNERIIHNFKRPPCDMFVSSSGFKATAALFQCLLAQNVIAKAVFVVVEPAVQSLNFLF